MIYLFKIIKKGIKAMNIIELETPSTTEKYFAPDMDNDTPFLITEYGKTLRDTPCYQLRMKSPIACVQYVISGSGVLICDDNIFNLNSGDTFLLPQGSNQIYYSNTDNQFERIWLNFKGELADSLLRIYKIDNITVFRNTNTHDILSEIIEACKFAATPQEYKNNSACLFLKLVQFLAENKLQTNNTSTAIEKIRLYIDCHISENLSLSDIAKNFSYSQEHIIRTFKKLYGITPHSYIIQSKMRIAMIMLKATNDSIEKISDSLCFSDPRHFSALFKKHVGRRPSVYRRQETFTALQP